MRYDALAVQAGMPMTAQVMRLLCSNAGKAFLHLKLSYPLFPQGLYQLFYLSVKSI
jgi:hypothetical protein